MNRVLVGFGIVAVSLCTSAGAQTVSGSLKFASDPNNYFDPANGYVPNGFGNKSGQSVAIGPGVEFGYNDGSNLLTADFTSGTLSLQETSYGFGAYNFTTTFIVTSPNFVFTSAALLSDMFNGTLTFSGKTLTFVSPNTISGSAVRSASIAFTSAVTPTGVPESATWAMLTLGFGGIGYAMRRKNKVAARIRFA